MTEDQEPVIKPEIDYEKSIRRNRLSYKLTAGFIFSFSASYFVSFMLLLAGILFLINPANRDSSGFTFFVTLFSICIILNPFFNNAFVKIKGKSKDINRQNILSVMDEFYNSYDFQIDDEKMLRSFKPSYQPIWGRIITILFYDDMMYLNITSLGKGNDPILGLGLWNFIKGKRIAAYYKRNFSD